MAQLALRAIECVCGETLEGRNDTALLEAYRGHAQSDHPEWSEAEIRTHFVRDAHDVPVEERG